MRKFDKNVSARSATLCVDVGREALARHVQRAEGAASAVPVLVSGTIDGVMSRDGDGGRTFMVSVDDVFLGCDYSVVLVRGVPGGSPFELGADGVERLDALAASVGREGLGILSSADYHNQGRVSVPAEWLRELVRGYRAAKPETALYLFSLAEIGDGSLKAVVVSDAAARSGEPQRAPVSETLCGRLPYGGTETEPGVIIYRRRKMDELRAEFIDGGFRDRP